MCNNHKLLPKEKRIALIIPSSILSDHKLSLNEKLILGIDYCFKLKLNYNSMLNIEISNLLKLHPNIISKARNNLLKLGYLKKEKRNYYLNEISLFVEKIDSRDLIIPFWIYHKRDLSTGAKLLWAEYNSFNNSGKTYFASREFTSNRIGCSIESITNWTKELLKKGLLKYELKSGYCTRQKIIITCKFSKDGEIIS